MARIPLISRVANTTLSYLFTGLACLAYALALQVVFEYVTVGLRWTTVATLTGATLLAVTLWYLNRLLDGSAPKPSNRSRRLKLVTVGVGAVLPIAILGYLLSESVVTTGASEWQQLTLMDGTNVHLDARSRIKVEYSDTTRIVRLYRGGGVFDVAKDTKRPFIVRTSSIDAMAVGTRFGVAIDAGVVTTVSEGIVKVMGRGIDGPAVAVNPNQELRVSDRSLAPPQPVKVDAERKLDLASGWLEMNGVTAAEAIEAFNRRNLMQIVLADPRLARVRFNGYTRLRLDSPQSCAAMIASWAEASVTVDKQNNVILVSK
jgi:transmembrane sensor